MLVEKRRDAYTQGKSGIVILRNLLLLLLQLHPQSFVPLNYYYYYYLDEFVLISLLNQTRLYLHGPLSFFLFEYAT
jgi:hypothetical protein